MFNNILKLRTRTINLAPHEAQHANVRFGSEADVRELSAHVRLVSTTDLERPAVSCPYADLNQSFESIRRAMPLPGSEAYSVAMPSTTLRMNFCDRSAWMGYGRFAFSMPRASAHPLQPFVR